jgi:hypothetical protein
MKRYRRNPAPDDDVVIVPAGYLRCTDSRHVGPRILPADRAHFKNRPFRRSPLGIEPTCKACDRRAALRRYHARVCKTPRQRACKEIDGNVLLILAGREFGVPLRLPDGMLVCSVCWQLLPHDAKHFNPDRNYRVEPVCRDCEKDLPPGLDSGS